MIGKRLLLVLAFALTSGLTSYGVSAQEQTDPPAVKRDLGDDQAAFDKLINDAKVSMMGAPSAALDLAKQAEALAAPLPVSEARNIALAQALWLEAEALNRTNHPDLARPLVTEAIALLDGITLDTELRGDLLLAGGRIDQAMGNVQSALESYLAASETFVELDGRRKQAITLQEIGGIYNDAGEFVRALTYYDRARIAFEAYLQQSGDTNISFLMVNHNNRANVLRRQGRPEEAKDHYQQALEIAQQYDSPTLNARIMSNLAATLFENGEVDAADAMADAGLAQIPEGVTSEWEPFLWGVKAWVASARGDQRLARSLIERTFEGEDLSSTPMPFRDFHEAAYKIYHGLGQDDKALEHLEAYIRLEDEALRTTASASTALATARFDFTSQELRIANQELQITAAKTRQRNIVFGFLGGGGVVILGLLTIGFINAIRSRNAIIAANETLNVTNQKLEKANNAKSEFLATTSHEIRTPLNGILGMSQVLLQDSSLDEDVRDKLQVLKSAGNSMKAIVDDLLDVAKIETGAVTVKKTKTDLKGLIQEASLLWKGASEEKSLAFATDLSDCPSNGWTDPQRLRQIVFNLLSNAVKFTEAGTVKLSAEGFEKDSTPWLRISIEDTGIGIPEAELEAIFEPFHQVDGAKSRKYAGTGLGLSISKNFAEALDGHISVTSELGKGSVFTLELPVSAVESDLAESAISNRHAEASQVENQDNPQDISLLILQPDFMQKLIFEAYFADEARQTVVVETLDEFQEKLEEGGFDVAIAPYSEDLPLLWLDTLSAQTGTEFVLQCEHAPASDSLTSAVFMLGEYSPEQTQKFIQSRNASQG